MVDIESRPIDARARIGWWLFVFLLAGVAAYLTYSFVGLLVLGVFVYYATRPIYQRIARRIDSDSIAAGLTVLLVLVPIIFLILYAGFQIVLPELVHSNLLTPTVLMGKSIGATPEMADEAPTDDSTGDKATSDRR